MPDSGLEAEEVGAVSSPEAELSRALTWLAYYWQTINETTQGFFEQLYEVNPDKVSEVLSGASLPRDGEHPTLASWAAAAPGESPAASLYISRGEVRVEPENPDPGQAFTVYWSGSTDSDFPARRDQVTIYQAETVAEQIVPQPPAPTGQVAGQATFGGLQEGEYSVVVLCNLDGSDGSQLSEQGMQTYFTAVLYVGEPPAKQIAEDYPKFTRAVQLIEGCAAMSFSESQDYLIEAASELASMRQLGQDFESEGLKSDLARIEGSLRSWRSDEAWIRVRDQLVRAASEHPQDQNIDAMEENAGTFATTFITLEDGTWRGF